MYLVISMMHSKFRHRDALWALIAQALVVLICLPVIWCFWQIQAAGSFLLGGLVCLLPNAYLYRKAFSHFGARQAKQILKDLFLGEAVKLLLTAGLFVGTLLISWALPLWIFIGFILAQVGFWLAPIYLGVRKTLIK
jgi:ATP synthase protein I